MFRKCVAALFSALLPMTAARGAEPPTPAESADLKEVAPECLVESAATTKAMIDKRLKERPEHERLDPGTSREFDVDGDGTPERIVSDDIHKTEFKIVNADGKILQRVRIPDLRVSSPKDLNIIRELYPVRLDNRLFWYATVQHLDEDKNGWNDATRVGLYSMEGELRWSYVSGLGGRYYSVSITAGDLNRDGKTEFVVGQGGFKDYWLSILDGSGRLLCRKKITPYFNLRVYPPRAPGQRPAIGGTADASGNGKLKRGTEGIRLYAFCPEREGRSAPAEGAVDESMFPPVPPEEIEELFVPRPPKEGEVIVPVERK